LSKKLNKNIEIVKNKKIKPPEKILGVKLNIIGK
jgi:hypothetical protein